MKVLNLACGHGHGFEGWFGSEDAFQDQRARGLVACPVCGDVQVEKRPSAPRLNLSHGRAPAAPGAGEAPKGAKVEEGAAAGGSTVPPSAEPLPAALAEMRAALWRATREAARKAEDVGPRFAEEARRIHHGEAEERGIRGQASPQEARALLEEGIGVLPLPDAFKETLQ